MVQDEEEEEEGGVNKRVERSKGTDDVMCIRNANDIAMLCLVSSSLMMTNSIDETQSQEKREKNQNYNKKLSLVNDCDERRRRWKLS